MTQALQRGFMDNDVTPPIVFMNAQHAVKWSQECAALPDVGSQLTKWQKMACRELTRAEVRDIAQTISTEIHAIQPWAGEALLAVYVGHNEERDIWLGSGIGGQLSVTEEGVPKGRHKLNRLGYTVIKSERAMRLYGDRYWYKRMAHDIGIHVDTFRKGMTWMTLMGLARDILVQWVERGLRALTVRLQELGWLAGAEDRAEPIPDQSLSWLDQEIIKNLRECGE